MKTSVMGIVGLGLLFGASAVWAVPAKEVRDGKNLMETDPRRLSR